MKKVIFLVLVLIALVGFKNSPYSEEQLEILRELELKIESETESEIEFDLEGKTYLRLTKIKKEFKLNEIEERIINTSIKAMEKGYTIDSLIYYMIDNIYIEKSSKNSIFDIFSEKWERVDEEEFKKFKYDASVNYDEKIISEYEKNGGLSGMTKSYSESLGPKGIRKSFYGTENLYEVDGYYETKITLTGWIKTEDTNCSITKPLDSFGDRVSYNAEGGCGWFRTKWRRYVRNEIKEYQYKERKGDKVASVNSDIQVTGEEVKELFGLKHKGYKKELKIRVKNNLKFVSTQLHVNYEGVKSDPIELNKSVEIISHKKGNNQLEIYGTITNSKSATYKKSYNQLEGYYYDVDRPECVYLKPCIAKADNIPDDTFTKNYTKYDFKNIADEWVKHYSYQKINEKNFSDIVGDKIIALSKLVDFATDKVPDGFEFGIEGAKIIEDGNMRTAFNILSQRYSKHLNNMLYEVSEYYMLKYSMLKLYGNLIKDFELITINK